jgi:superfamily II DNA or RNA helicase
MEAILSGWMFVPYDVLNATVGVEAEKKALTHLPPMAEEGTEPLYLYRDYPSRGYLAVPRAYGLSRFPWLGFRDLRTEGIPMSGPPPRLPDPNHPRVKDPAQQQAFMNDLLAGALEYKQFTAMASTGSGKTVCALWLAAQLGRKTLVMVPLERLMHQWVDEVKDKLGLPDSKIGIVQGDTCQWEDRDIVIGMMHSLSMKKYSPEFYRAFGLVVIDECHRVGSHMLSRVAPLFPSLYRVGLSATPKRKDGNDRVGFWHIGPVRVTSKAKALDCDVFVKPYVTRRPLWGKDFNSRMKCLSQDPDRNALLTALIVRAYNGGRHVLVIGKYVDHLQEIRDACIRAGLPANDLGQYTGEVHHRQLVNTIHGPRMKTVRKTKIAKEEYDRVKRECRVIFATYGVFKEGIDVPRLDCGIDILPQSEATQVVGRIRRPMEDKPRPVWITLLDERCAFSTRLFNARKKEYIQSGCRVIEPRST